MARACQIQLEIKGGSLPHCLKGTKSNNSPLLSLPLPLTGACALVWATPFLLEDGGEQDCQPPWPPGNREATVGLWDSASLYAPFLIDSQTQTRSCPPLASPCSEPVGKTAALSPLYRQEPLENNSVMWWENTLGFSWKSNQVVFWKLMAWHQSALQPKHCATFKTFRWEGQGVAIIVKTLRALVLQILNYSVSSTTDGLSSRLFYCSYSNTLDHRQEKEPPSDLHTWRYRYMYMFCVHVWSHPLFKNTLAVPIPRRPSSSHWL